MLIKICEDRQRVQVELNVKTLQFAHSILLTHLKVDPTVRYNDAFKLEFVQAANDLKAALDEAPVTRVPR